MLKILKKSVAIILAFTMLISAMSTVIFATDTAPSADVSNAQQIYAGETVTAEFFGDGEYVWYKFIPETDGKYIFSDESFGIATNGYLYDSEMNVIDYDASGQSTFVIRHELTAGETYYLAVRFYDETIMGVINVEAKFFPVQSISFEPITFIDTESFKDTDDEGIEYDRYGWFNELSFTVQLTNGETIQDSGLSFFMMAIGTILSMMTPKALKTSGQ